MGLRFFSIAVFAWLLPAPLLAQHLAPEARPEPPPSLSAPAPEAALPAREGKQAGETTTPDKAETVRPPAPPAARGASGEISPPSDGEVPGSGEFPAAPQATAQGPDGHQRTESPPAADFQSEIRQSDADQLAGEEAATEQAAIADPADETPPAAVPSGEAALQAEAVEEPPPTEEAALQAEAVEEPPPTEEAVSGSTREGETGPEPAPATEPAPETAATREAAPPGTAVDLPSSEASASIREIPVRPDGEAPDKSSAPDFARPGQSRNGVAPPVTVDGGEHFPTAPIIEVQKGFWIRIFSEIPSDEGLLHDRELTLPVYKHVVLGDRSRRAQRR
jgi:hypothetical protein